MFRFNKIVEVANLQAPTEQKAQSMFSTLPQQVQDTEALRRKRLLSLRLGLMSTMKSNKFNAQTLPGNTLLGGGI